MSKLTITNPVAKAQIETADAERIAPARRKPSLEDRTVGLYWNGKNLKGSGAPLFSPVQQNKTVAYVDNAAVE